MSDIQSLIRLSHQLQDRDAPQQVREALRKKLAESDGNGNTPLHNAAKEGLTEITLVYLAYGACYEKRNNDGKIPRQVIPTEFKDLRCLYGTLDSQRDTIVKMSEDEVYGVKEEAELWIRQIKSPKLKALLYGRDSAGYTLMENTIMMGNAPGAELIARIMFVGDLALVPPLVPRLACADVRPFVVLVKALLAEGDQLEMEQLREPANAGQLVALIRRVAGVALNYVNLSAPNDFLASMKSSCDVLLKKCDELVRETEPGAVVIAGWCFNGGTYEANARKLIHVVKVVAIEPMLLAARDALTRCHFEAVLRNDAATLQQCLLADDARVSTYVNLNYTDNTGSTSLLHAARNSSWAIIDILLSVRNGIDFSSIIAAHRLTILGALIRGNFVGHLSRLFSDFEDVPEALEARNEQGFAPLHVAASVGQLDCMRAMVDGRANLWALTTPGNRSVLHLAAEQGHVHVVAYALEGVKLQPRLLRWALDAREETHERTALHVACVRGQIDAARALLRYGANVDLEDRESMLPEQLVAVGSAMGHLFRAVRELYVKLAANRDEEMIVDLEQMSLPDRQAVCGATRDTGRHLQSELLALGKTELLLWVENLLKSD